MTDRQSKVNPWDAVASKNLDDVRNEQYLLQKSAKTIQRKLKSKSFKELIKDEEFGNSIFQRFAASGLPLREGNK